MVNAIVKANQFIRGHSAAEIAARLPASIVDDRYIYVKSLEHSRPAFSKDGAILHLAVENNLQSQIAFGLVSRGALDPSHFWNDHFVRAALGH
jgi:hypothetical protein